jgi:Tfp pilus assembly protein PilF
MFFHQDDEREGQSDFVLKQHVAGKLQKARQHLQKILKLAPGYPDTPNIHAVLYHQP